VLAVEPYEAADFTGDFVVSGTVEDESGRPVTGALVELAYQAGAMHGENTPLVAETSMDGNFSFSARRHPNWYLRVSKEGYKDTYAFDLTREPLTITLQPFSREVPQYERVKQVQTERYKIKPYTVSGSGGIPELASDTVYNLPGEPGAMSTRPPCITWRPVTR